MSKTAKIITLLLATTHLLSCADSLSGNNDDEKRLFDQISKGMHRDTVVRILGKPDNISHSFDSSSYHYYYFSKNKSVMRSTMPSVTFDTTDKVTFATYGDEG